MIYFGWGRGKKVLFPFLLLGKKQNEWIKIQTKCSLLVLCEMSFGNVNKSYELLDYEWLHLKAVKVTVYGKCINSMQILIKLLI